MIMKNNSIVTLVYSSLPLIEKKKKRSLEGEGALVFFIGLLVIKRLFAGCLILFFLHGKNILLPLESTKFRVVNQWLF
jgi:hypothetical protein